MATKLPLTICFLAFYLIGQAKTSISSLQLSRQLGVTYNTAWMLYNKILRTTSKRDDCYVLLGKVQMDDACFGGAAGEEGLDAELEALRSLAGRGNSGGQRIIRDDLYAERLERQRGA